MAETFKQLVADTATNAQAAETAKTAAESANTSVQSAKVSVDASKADVEAYAQDMLLHLQITEYDLATPYAFPKAVIGDDGETYRCLKPAGSEITGIAPVDDGINWKRISNAFPATLNGGTF